MFGIALMFILSSVSFIIAEKQCVSGSEFINIISPNAYAIDANINNVTIKLKAGTFDFSKTKVTAILYEGATEIGTKLTNGFVNNAGEVTVDFKYASPRSAELLVKFIVDNGAGQTFTASKIIKILPTLDNKLSCDIQGYINREVTCTWKTYDKGTTNLVAALPNIQVKQGSTNLAYAPVGSSGITFSTPTTGAVSVTVAVSKDGYNGDIDTTTVSIQSITTQTSLNIDNKDFLTYGGQFTTGVHSLELIAKDSGLPSEVLKIDAIMTSPAGQKINIEFNKISTGVFRTSYTLSDPGQTYSLDGTIVYEGARDSIPFSYKLATSQTTTEDLASQTNIILISSIVGGVILVLFIVLAIWLKKRK
jgi:hypothetical protein